MKAKGMVVKKNDTCGCCKQENTELISIPVWRTRVRLCQSCLSEAFKKLNKEI